MAIIKLLLLFIGGSVVKEILTLLDKGWREEVGLGVEGGSSTRDEERK